MLKNSVASKQNWPHGKFDKYKFVHSSNYCMAVNLLVVIIYFWTFSNIFLFVS